MLVASTPTVSTVRPAALSSVRASLEPVLVSTLTTVVPAPDKLLLTTVALAARVALLTSATNSTLELSQERLPPLLRRDSDRESNSLIHSAVVTSLAMVNATVAMAVASLAMVNSTAATVVSAASAPTTATTSLQDMANLVDMRSALSAVAMVAMAAPAMVADPSVATAAMVAPEPLAAMARDRTVEEVSAVMVAGERQAPAEIDCLLIL